jgi:hypothetical protein
LEAVSKILVEKGYSEASSRQLIKRGKVVAVKRDNKWLSHKEVAIIDKT